MISEIYLGEIARLVLNRMALESDVFGDAADNLSTPFILRCPLLNYFEIGPHFQLPDSGIEDEYGEMKGTRRWEPQFPNVPMAAHLPVRDAVPAAHAVDPAFARVPVPLQRCRSLLPACRHAKQLRFVQQYMRPRFQYWSSACNDSESDTNGNILHIPANVILTCINFSNLYYQGLGWIRLRRRKQNICNVHFNIKE